MIYQRSVIIVPLTLGPPGVVSFMLTHTPTVRAAAPFVQLTDAPFLCSVFDMHNFTLHININFFFLIASCILSACLSRFLRIFFKAKFTFDGNR